MPHKHIIKANIYAGFLSGLVAPVIFPLVILLTEGKLPDWSTYPLAAISIFAFATVLSLAACIIIGIPALSILEKNKLNTPIITAISGLFIATIIFFALSVINNYPPLTQTWPLAAFFVFLGSFCGYTASTFSSTNKSFKPTPKSGAV
jgi:hypothetical protein